MDKEILEKKLQVSRILFKYNVPINDAKIIGTFIEELEQQVKKQKEVIDKAIEYINENVYEDDNGCGDYWWEIANKGELLKILENKEVSE